ncbi:hypothetical protein SPRG_01571 [Saprolegnia parasitica CBS 223.65]|uniref:Uncharacterized protein n=1 Tax=Saprolegnia parasitica (strain CBS 223.65) TaxID=695850 RepID=A0A067D6W2_SAPPC|nr:hypothetical protein SPRG_01571 [Saprolegnia parasitica CBS 223.65]KDO34436.1 hypothetical protein SPRG_01571 [Saprolegnia parasitica CBS 223.65]|eukprot:XP_012195167.1 hypothetical protein SPRG_01571 [Saprolegnia parasitica CBS 223.65]
MSEHKDVRPIALLPPKTPITAIDPKFVLAQPVRLRIRHRPDAGECIIRDELTGAPYFIMDPTFWSMHDRKLLRDATGAEVAAIESRTFTPGRSDVLRTNGHGKATSFLLRFDVSVALGNVEVKCEFQDVVTKMRRVFAATGGAGSSVVLYSNGRPIAKWLKDWSFSDGGYVFLDVSPGVDLALIVLLCTSMVKASEKWAFR